MSDFQGKVALITGASTGIGRATARAFARDGAKLVLADVNSKDGEQIACELRDAQAEALFVQTDVSRAEDCERLVARTLDTFGRLDAAFNNAGIAEGPPQIPTANYPLERWERVIAINLSGTFYCMRYQIPALLSSGGGAIVNTSSVAGQIAFDGTAGYTASKHGVVGLTKVVAGEYSARGIRCNAIGPGFIDTQMIPEESRAWMESVTPAGRLGTPEEIAEAVLWLCSPRAAFITGAYIAADGGYLCR